MELLLTAEELRVLACLVEKSFTTPDQYPLTTNSLTNACNQKTSREPVVDYPSQLVDRTMLALRDAGWARSVRGAGNRAFKHKHVMDEKLGVSAAEQAVLAVLALRGPQSAGELCTRTERYGVFTGDRDEAFATVEETLAALAGRESPLVRNIGRASGQSQDRWIQLIGDLGPGADLPEADPVVGTSAHVETMGAPILADVQSSPSAVTQATTLPPPGLDVIESLSERLAALEQRVSDLEELL